jgi:UDP-N-acetylmuramoyl-L-alanyl-D-glutamate--2,6-diaminopimelate ligase
MSPTPPRAIRYGLDQLLDGYAEADKVPPVEIRGLTLDSRQVREGDLFVALPGFHAHGLGHAGQAIQRGASAIVYDPAGDGEALVGSLQDLPCLRVESLTEKLGHIADRFFGEPSRQFSAVIGITGTNGKTSCSHFLAQALSSLGPYGPGASLGTLGWGSPGALQPTTHTTPDAIEIQRILGQLRDQGFRSVAMEASSHGLEQGRLNGARFKGALYTNFTRDHLDYHKTMEAYLEAKLKLLAMPGLEFVAFNADDPSAAAILAKRPENVQAIGFTKQATNPNHLASAHPFTLLRISDIQHGTEGVSFLADYAGQSTRLHAPVFGGYNVENLAASLAALLGLGLSLAEAAKALGQARAVPGRMESFVGAGRQAVVDYAHTPDALSNVLSSLRGHCQGQLWAVFGCGGDRDAGKRPQMGAIAERLADHVILTDDNPRTEDGGAILRDIQAGCQRAGVVSIRDRRAAIAYALEQAARDDIVLIAGKGHESTQEIQGHKYPFSDRQVVRDILDRLETQAAPQPSLLAAHTR